MEESYSWKKESSSSSSSSRSHLPRSFSTKSSSGYSKSSSSGLPRSVSQRSSNISQKCSNMAKEQKTKFYIVKRCVAMLVRWNKHRDDS